VQKFVEQDAEHIRKRQKLIKIAHGIKDGWQVVEAYGSDDLASGSKDEKRPEKAKDTSSRERKQKELLVKSRETGQKLMLVLRTISFFVLCTVGVHLISCVLCVFSSG